MDACNVEGCGRDASSVGFCDMHYYRYRKYGDPLGGPPFKARKGEIAVFIQEAINFSGDECLIWPFARNSAGYGHFQKDKIASLAHRFVCERVNGASPLDRPLCLHSCGKGHTGCCAPRHLYWGTASDNSGDMADHGRSQRGEKMWASKLTEVDVREIRSSPDSALMLAKRFGVTPSNIICVKRRFTWRHVA